jgi:hypothetical protein
MEETSDGQQETTQEGAREESETSEKEGSRANHPEDAARVGRVHFGPDRGIPAARLVWPSASDQVFISRWPWTNVCRWIASSAQVD